TPAKFGEVQVPALADGERRPVDVVVVPARAVSGRVLDESGAGAAEAAVIAASDRVCQSFGSFAWLHLQFVASTDADGSVVFGGLPPADGWRLEAGRPGEGGASDAAVAVPADGSVAAVVIRLRALGSVRGRVTDPSRHPVAGVFVAVESGPASHRQVV